MQPSPTPLNLEFLIALHLPDGLSQNQRLVEALANEVRKILPELMSRGFTPEAAVRRTIQVPELPLTNTRVIARLGEWWCKRHAIDRILKDIDQYVPEEGELRSTLLQLAPIQTRSGDAERLRLYERAYAILPDELYLRTVRHPELLVQVRPYFGAIENLIVRDPWYPYGPNENQRQDRSFENDQRVTDCFTQLPEELLGEIIHTMHEEYAAHRRSDFAAQTRIRLTTLLNSRQVARQDSDEVAAENENEQGAQRGMFWNALQRYRLKQIGDHTPGPGI